MGGGWWTARSFTHSWDKLYRSYPASPRVPQWGWAPGAHSGCLFENIPLTGFPLLSTSCPHFFANVLGYRIPRQHSSPHLDRIWSPQGKPKVEDLTKRLIQNTQKQYSQEDFLESTKIKIASLFSHCLLLFKIWLLESKVWHIIQGFPYEITTGVDFLFFFFFCLLKVRDYSPPLLVIKSVWQDSSEVLWPSGHVAAAQAGLQTGLLAVMC